jgi:hypothetical protein
MTRPQEDNHPTRRFKTSIRSVKLNIETAKSKLEKLKSNDPEVKKAAEILESIYFHDEESEEEIDEEIQFNELLDTLPDEHASLATRSNWNLEQLKQFHEFLFKPSPDF